MIPGGVRIFVCTAPVDLRHGFDRLAQTARERVGADPMSGGALFVFANKRATRLKVLWFEKNGFCLLYKRLHQAVFELPAAGAGVRIRAYRRFGAGKVARGRAERRCAIKENVTLAFLPLDSDRQILHA